MRYGSVLEMVEDKCDKAFADEFVRQLLRKQDATIHRLIGVLSKYEPDAWKYLVEDEMRTEGQA